MVWVTSCWRHAGLAALCAVVLLLAPLSTGGETGAGEARVRIAITNNGIPEELPPEHETALRVFIDEEPMGAPPPEDEVQEENTDAAERFSHRQAPACQETTNDARETYQLTGWHLPATGLTYRVNTRRAPRDIRDAVADAIQRGVATWTAVDHDKVLTDGGETEQSRPRYDGESIITWRGLPRGIVGAAFVWYDPATGTVVEADMVFSSRVKWAVNDADGDCSGAEVAYDLQAVATHEFGHWLGLDDLYDTGDVDLTMFGIVTHQELKKSSLGRGDVLGTEAVAP